MSRIDLPKERHVGHLTLHRQGRKISTREYNALSRSERMTLVRQASGKQKYDLLLNAVDAEELVSQLHPQELYLTVNELGSEYSTELLMLANTEQITTLLDLDCWDGDTVSPVLSLHWLQLLLDTGADKVCQLTAEIEPEILAIFLKKHMTIIRGLEAYDDDDADNARRLESLYDIEFASEDAAKVIGAFLKIIMEQAQPSYLLLMEMIRSEISSSLEEEVFQSRNNRLSDLGFMPRNEAMSIYTLIDPAHFSPGGKDDYRLEAEALPNPGALLAQAGPNNLLAEILTNGLSHELATELCMLANRKMSADSIDISSTEDIGSSLQQLYDTLNLALEYLVGNNIEQAMGVVNQTYLLQLFQLGHSLLQQLQDQAKTLLQSDIGAYLDYPEQLFLDALLESPPVLYCLATEDAPSRLQAISTVKELEHVTQRLQEINDLLQLFTQHLPFSMPEHEQDDSNETTLSMLFLTAVANQLLGREMKPTPLAKEDLLLLKSQATKTDFSEQLQEKLYMQLKDSNLNCLNFIDFCIDCLLDDLNYLNIDQLDSEETFCLLLAD